MVPAPGVFTGSIVPRSLRRVSCSLVPLHGALIWMKLLRLLEQLLLLFDSHLLSLHLFLLLKFQSWLHLLYALRVDAVAAVMAWVGERLWWIQMSSHGVLVLVWVCKWGCVVFIRCRCHHVFLGSEGVDGFCYVELTIGLEDPCRRTINSCVQIRLLRIVGQRIQISWLVPAGLNFLFSAAFLVADTFFKCLTIKGWLLPIAGSSTRMIWTSLLGRTSIRCIIWTHVTFQMLWAGISNLLFDVVKAL